MRKMYFNGSFYSNNIDELNKIFNEKNENRRGSRGNAHVLTHPALGLNDGINSGLNDNLNDNLNDKKIDNSDNELGSHKGLPVPIIPRVRGIIVPHAGYIYSGACANKVYRIAGEQEFKRVVVIGPSHRIYFKGASVCLEESYETPLGDLSVDVDYSEKIVEKIDYIKYIKEAHGEHSTETQMPFIKNYFEKSKVVEIVYGDIDYDSLSELVEFVMSDESNLLVISTDLSHFYSEKEAYYIDRNCINALKNLDNEILFKKGEACGMAGMMAGIKVAKSKDMKSVVVDYRTSADSIVATDKSRVVGYMSGIIYS